MPKERGTAANRLSKKLKLSRKGSGNEAFPEWNPQDGLCFIKDGEMNGFLVNKVEGKKIYPNKMDGIKSGTLLYRNFDAKFEKQLTNSKTVRKIGVSLRSQIVLLLHLTKTIILS